MSDQGKWIFTISEKYPTFQAIWKCKKLNTIWSNIENRNMTQTLFVCKSRLGQRKHILLRTWIIFINIILQEEVAQSIVKLQSDLCKVLFLISNNYSILLFEDEFKHCVKHYFSKICFIDTIIKKVKGLMLTKISLKTFDFSR